MAEAHRFSVYRDVRPFVPLTQCLGSKWAVSGPTLVAAVGEALDQVAAARLPDDPTARSRQRAFRIVPRRFMTETISGSIPAFQRPTFARLVDRVEEHDRIVIKIDRLGRNTMDVRSTVD